MLDAIIYIGLGFIGGQIYSYIQTALAVRSLMRELEQLESNPKSGPEVMILFPRKLTCEQIGTNYYFYDNGEFVCQGATLEEAAQNAQTLGCKLALFEHQGQSLRFFNGRVESTEAVQTS